MYLNIDNIVISNDKIKINTLGMLQFGKKLGYNEPIENNHKIVKENRLIEKNSIKETGKIVIQLLCKISKHDFEVFIPEDCPQNLLNFYDNITSE